MDRSLVQKTLLLMLVMSFLPQAMGQSKDGSLQDLPEEVLSSLPSEIREDIARTYSLIQSDPSNATMTGQLGMVLHANGQLEIAFQLYDLALSVAPNTFEWVYYRAVVQEALSHSQEAIASLKQALLIDASYIPARLRLADLQYREGNWKQSLEIYRDILADYPDLAVAHYGLGRNLIALKALEEAIEHFKKACDLTPDFGAAHYALAQAFRDSGKIEEARIHLELYREHPLHRPVVGDGLVDSINQLKPVNTQAQEQARRGVALAEKGDLAEAIGAHRKAIEFDPSLIQSHIQIGILQGRLGQLDLAEEAFRDALDVNPNSEEAYYNLGVLQMQRNEIDAAIESFEHVIQINPLNSSASNSLGQLAELKGDLATAETHYRTALKSNATNRLARFNLGRLLIERGSFREAIREIEFALSPADERTPRFLFAISVAHVRLGDITKGIEFGERARALAERFGQTELVDLIERDLQRLRQTEH